MKYMEIDWKDKGYTVRIIDEQGKDLSGSFEVKKNQKEFETLLEKIRKHSSDYREVFIGIETERDAIVDYLLGLGFRLYLVSPNMMKSLRKRHTGSGKWSDNLDSYVIADAVRTDRGKLEVIKGKSEKIRRIEFLYRQMDAAGKDRNRLINRLTSFLKEYFPAFLDFFEDAGGSTALAFLQEYPTFEDVKGLSMEEIRSFLRSHHYYKESGVRKIWKAIRGTQVKIDPVVVEARSKAALSLAKRIQLIDEEVKIYQKELKEIIEGDQDGEVFESLPGAGEKTVPGLMIIFGEDRERYENAEGINALSGMIPVTKSSGNWEVHLFRFACNHFYRNIIIQWAYASLNESEWARAYYNKKRAEGKNHYHALRCLGRLWIKVAFALWKDRQKYNEDRHMAALQRHRVRNELVKRIA